MVERLEKSEGDILLEVGVEIREIKRVEKIYRRCGGRFLSRVYTERELKHLSRLPTKNQALLTAELAARLAGKEAVAKALGRKGFFFKEIEILNEPSGKPKVELHGQAQELAFKLGISDLAISLTHTGEYALAMVVAEGRKKELVEEVTKHLRLFGGGGLSWTD